MTLGFNDILGLNRRWEVPHSHHPSRRLLKGIGVLSVASVPLGGSIQRDWLARMLYCLLVSGIIPGFGGSRALLVYSYE